MKKRNLVAGLAALVMLASPGKHITDATIPVMANVPPIQEALEPEKYAATEQEIKRLAQMIYWEGAVCSDGEKIAIGYSAMNRVNDGEKKFGKSLNEVIRHPAYSFFDPKKVERSLRNPCNREIFNDCYEIAQGIAGGKYPDPTNGAKYYFNPKIVKKPKWPWKTMEKIGHLPMEEGQSHHKFYGELEPAS